MKYFAGVDIGSRTTKIVIWSRDSEKQIITKVVATGISPGLTAKQVLLDLIDFHNLKFADCLNIYATGYSKDLFPEIDGTVAEISCHTKGVLFYYPTTDIIIDIGGQDSKVIFLENQRPIDFVMNDKCAAGTGRFLEMLATFFHTDIISLSKTAENSQKEIPITSTCAVFTESEIVELISQGENKNDIVNGVYLSLARRIKSMISKPIKGREIVFTGGVAQNQGIVQALQKTFQQSLLITPDPSITGALGAALFAAQNYAEN